MMEEKEDAFEENDSGMSTEFDEEKIVSEIADKSKASFGDDPSPDGSPRPKNHDPDDPLDNDQLTTSYVGANDTSQIN